jgi:hypothetical protein
MELFDFLENHKLTSIEGALIACGVTTLKDVKTRLASPKTSYGFCANLLNKGVHNRDLKLLKCCCRECGSDSIKVVETTWNFCLLLPFDLVVPSQLEDVARNPLVCDDQDLEFATVKMCFA